MKLFNVTINDTGEELCVAARTMDHAAEVLITFWLARTGNAPGQFSVGRGALSAYGDDYIVQNVAAGDVAGVLVRQTDGSTLFEPAIG
jgi:hypothetical protein